MIAVAFSPMLSEASMWALGAAAITIASLGLIMRARGAVLRTVLLALVWGALWNPTIVTEDRTALPDIALVIVDESKSQGLDDRAVLAETTADTIEAALSDMPDVDIRTVRAGVGASLEDGTALMGALNQALSNVPAGRLGAAFLVTDGIAHDVPSPAMLNALPGPVHTILTGRKNEQDRRIEILEAPDYMLVGNTARIRLSVTDAGTAAEGAQVPLTIRSSGRPAQEVNAPIGAPIEIAVPVERGGANVFELSVPASARELTPQNNRTALTIQGVRDRLKVLLISGEPHVGERAWRNLLKSDPNVDLVHFTILRPLTKDDGTPLSELALISFPIRELFEEQLYDFDLVIFDRYSRRGLVPAQYMVNIARYVEDGGAILLAVGPEYADIYTLYDSPLRSVLPGAPTGRVMTRPFRPALTDIGRKHPVTASLDTYSDADGQPYWGRWLRQVDIIASRGTNVMAGSGNDPLLVLDRVNEGRVALLLSDTVWLWGKGYDGGGPQAELMRRLGHWLMKEPELEEEWLSATAGADSLSITRRTLTRESAAVTVTSPDGSDEIISLTETAPGRLTAELQPVEPGVYTIKDGPLSAVAAVGGANPLELVDVLSTSERLQPVAEATGGGILWAVDTPNPDIRSVGPDRPASGANWLGLKRNGAYAVDRVSQIPLLPAFALLFLLFGGLLLTWWREGR